MNLWRFTAMAVAAILAFAAAGVAQTAADPRVAALGQELANKGWLVYGARAESGSWDLFLSRPDGSQRRNITNTPDAEEAAPRFSPDGKKMLFRRLAKGTKINHDQWGFQGELMLANADGTGAVALGGEGEFPWGAWSPDGTQISCLTKKGIQIVNLANKQVVKEVPRKGIYQQLFWSPDGQWFCGTGNLGGESWTVVRLNFASGEINAVRKFQNCTPDWFPDSKRIILSNRPGHQAGDNGYGYTQLWMSDGDGQNQQMIYGEDEAHAYGGLVSPDMQYVLFTKSPKDGSGSDKDGGMISIMRLSDAPTIGGESKELRKIHPDTKDGPVFTLCMGWEPHWTYAEIGGQP